jgi:AraC-like DNA-binding protein
VRRSLLKRLPVIQNFEALAHECGYKVQVMAWKLNVSSRTLQRYITDHFGKPTNEHLNALRMARAYTLAEAGKVGLKEIAHSLGYTQYTHFCRHFTETFGLSPAHLFNNEVQVIPPFCKKHRQRIRAYLRERRAFFEA